MVGVQKINVRNVRNVRNPFLWEMSVCCPYYPKQVEEVDYEATPS